MNHMSGVAINEILEIENYTTVLFQSQSDHFALIVLYAKKDPSLGLRIFFRRNEIEPIYGPSGRGIIIESPRSSYEPTLELLRNERPIYLHVYPTGCVLQTSKEPVGEKELNP